MFRIIALPPWYVKYPAAAPNITSLNAFERDLDPTPIPFENLNYVKIK